MGLLRIVIQKPEGKPLANLDVVVHNADLAESENSIVGQATTDKEGVARLRVDPGVYKVHFKKLPKNMNPPKYGTIVRLEDFAEGIEQIIRLVDVTS